MKKGIRFTAALLQKARIPMIYDDIKNIWRLKDAGKGGRGA